MYIFGFEIEIEFVIETESKLSLPECLGYMLVGRRVRVQYLSMTL